ncbi:MULTISPECIES: PH domain-containing protein [Bhargavaea]|uniref:PH domain-containing protein n=1 Tax=Bhargavaea changchunensis TaxID=2134037 RepID=A0ABW2NA87_9BACL|nr:MULTISPECIES: PH domain-containing protein [Bhargavaea]
MADLSGMLAWTFSQEVAIPDDVENLLIDGEEAVVAYKTVRDVAVVTNKRFIISDKQGLTGKKVEVYTIPFNSINMYSTENAGKLDFNAEIELWTRAGKMKINLGRGVDIRKLDKIIAQAIL